MLHWFGNAGLFLFSWIAVVALFVIFPPFTQLSFFQGTKERAPPGLFSIIP